MTFLSTLKKQASTAGDVLNSKGDLLSRNSSDLARLAVGSDGKVLTAKASEATGLEWSTPADENPTSTKGDLSGFSDVIARVPIGTNFNVLTAKSSVDLGLAWSPSSTSVLTTAGDLLYASSANTLARLAKGTDNQVLKMNGSALNWETLSGGASVTAFEFTLSTDFSTTSSSYVDVTNLTVDKPTITSGKCMTTYNISLQNSGDGKLYSKLDDNGTLVAAAKSEFSVNKDTSLTASDTSDADGNTLKVQIKSSSSTTTVQHDFATGSDRMTRICGLGVG